MQFKLKKLIIFTFKHQVSAWKEAMAESDFNNDGKLTFLEFQDAVKLAEKKTLDVQEN